MNEIYWTLWQINTAKNWQDLEGVLYDTHVEFVDHDHKILLEYMLQLNLLFTKAQEHLSLPLIYEVRTVLSNLYAFATEHFEREEQFMKQYALPETAQHLLEHEKILRTLKSEIDEYNSGHSMLSYQFKSSIIDWLLNHINGYDIRFFDIEHWHENIGKAQTWSDLKMIIFEVGIQDIDEQHRQLTELAMTCFDRMAKTNLREVLLKEMDSIMTYASFHFDFEIELMARFQIEKRDEHQREHHHFLQSLRGYANELLEASISPIDVKRRVLTWWISHINIVDRHYFSFGNWIVKQIEMATDIETLSLLLRKTGIKQIDDDHLHVLELSLKLNEWLSAYTDIGFDQKPTNEVLYLLKEVHAFAKAHFEREEVIMQENNMNQFLSHQEEHRKILKIFKDLENRSKEGLLVVSPQLKNVILNRWLEHTNVIDYRAFRSMNIMNR